MSGSAMQRTKGAAESPRSSETTSPSSFDRDGNLFGITAVQKAFHFLEGPAEVLRASVACRRWHQLACGDSVWRDKAEREGILDKAKAFEVELPEGASLEDEETAALAFYARVFVLKVRDRQTLSQCRRHDERLVSRTNVGT